MILVDRPYQPNGSPCSYTSDDNHLYGSFERLEEILASSPPGNDSGLYPTEDEKGNGHDSDTDPETGEYLIAWNTDIRKQRNEAAEEVAQSDCRCGHERPRSFGLWHLVVVSHEKVQQVFRRFVEDCRHFTKIAGWEAVRLETCSHHRICFAGRRPNESPSVIYDRIIRFPTSVSCQAIPGQGRGLQVYFSLFAPIKPPRPMEIAPAMSSARPPRTTSRASPSEDKPAVSAKGTVRPSERPIMASLITCGLGCQRFFFLAAWASASGKQSSHG